MLIINLLIYVRLTKKRILKHRIFCAWKIQRKIIHFILLKEKLYTFTFWYIDFYQCIHMYGIFLQEQEITEKVTVNKCYSK